MSAWTPILDRLEHQLRRQERAFTRGTPVPPAVTFARPDESMTPTETIRATDLMLRTDALIDRAVVVVRFGRGQGPSPYDS